MIGKKKHGGGRNQDYAGLAYEEALRKYADMVTRICVTHCGNTEDAKDCFQNVFIKLYTYDKKFVTEEHLKAWLIQVTVHQCMDYHRQAWKQKIDLQEDITQFEMLGAVTDGSTEDSALFLAVKSLPDKYRDVIYLYYYEEYSVSQIAAMLGSNDNTIKSQLKRGREKLKEILEGGISNEMVI